MPAVNGTLTPPSSHDIAAATGLGTKRKRTGSESRPQVNGVHDGYEQTAGAALQSDILVVLRRYDTQPSMLDCRLPAAAKRSPSSEPSSKKPRLQTGDAATVGLRLEAGYYTSLDDLTRDVQTVATELLKHVEANQSAPDNRLSTSDTRLWTGVKAFQKILHGMISRECQQKSITTAPSEKDTHGDIVKLEDQETDMSAMLENGRKVLTIFANPGGPRQLFSSFQKSLRVGAGGDIVDKDSDAVAHVTVPLAEASLPQVISTTTIPQLLVEDGLKSKKSRPTFGEVFAPPVTLPQLLPPRPSKQLTTKGSTITFVSNDTPSKRIRRDSRDTYSWVSQPMTLGHWLGWGGVDPPQEPTSPEAKRRQRDRALSTGEAKPPLSLSELRDAQQARIDALFRKVYSSFAPSHDDSSAIVSERVKNQAWWSKTGRARAQNALLIDPELSRDMNTMNTQAIEDEEKEFEKAVEEFEPENLSDSMMEDHEPSEKDVDDLLDDISNLIETLYSYQLIRNASLAITSRTPIGQNSSLTELTGSPNTPSAAEFEVYKILKAQLAVLITQLPPHAVARLDGDRLKELNVSTKILIETSTDSGVMEEDQITRIAKQNALSSAVGTSTVNARGTSGSGYTSYPPSATQYNRGTPLQPGSVQRSSTSYYPHQQPPNRPPPSLPYSRSSSGLQQFAGSYSTAVTPRTGYSQQQYTPTTQRPAGFQSGSNPYLHQLQSIAGKTNYNQQYGYSQGQGRGYNQQTPASNYQQRSSNTAPVYNSNYPQSPYRRTASPLNAANVQPPQYGIQARAGYSTPASSGQARSQYFPPGQNPNNQQQAAIDRQRAEIAAQTQARLAAATAVGGQASVSPGSQGRNSGTPQPQQMNGAPLAA